MDFFISAFSRTAPEFFAADNLLLMTVGVAVGLIIGALPGFSTSMGMVLFLPFTFGMSPVLGITTMIGILVGGTSGALVGAMLTGIPGTPASYATTFDGFPMARGGQPGLALGLGTWASFFGGVIGWCVLVVMAPWISVIGLEFGPWDYFTLILFALTIAASLSGRTLVKGLLAATFGMFVASIGTDPINNVERLTFGVEVLRPGFDIMPLLVGFFAFAQLMSDFEEKKRIRLPLVEAEHAKAVPIAHWTAIKTIMRQRWNLLRSALIGVFVGVVPAVGAQISNIIAYDQAKKASHDPDSFGTGNSEGIIAPEAANNATQGGSLAILMSMGIPGDVVTTVLLGALTIHNVAPSPTFIVENPVIAYTIFLAFLFSTVVMVALQAFGLRIFLLLTRLPMYLIGSVIMFFCAVGVFAWANVVDEIWTVVIFGVLGYLMKIHGFPLPPFVLGVVLGRVAELNLVRALSSSDDLSLFLTRPWALFFLILTLFSVLYPVCDRLKSKHRWPRYYSAALCIALSLPLFLMGETVRAAIAVGLVAAGGWLIWASSRAEGAIGMGKANDV